MELSLYDTQLGTLDLGCYPYVVTQLQIGSPQVRVVARNRALADGAFDDTRFIGSRAVTATLRLNNRGNGLCDPGGSTDMQTLIDRVVPYMSPRRRPTLTYQLPGAPLPRSMTVRGESWPVAIDGPKYPTLPLQWVNPTGEIFSGGAGEQNCETIVPSSDTEQGRTYDLVPSRTYPASAQIGGRIIKNTGNAPAHWTLTLYGVVTNPTFTINGVLVSFARNGGLQLNVGQNVVIDTRTRTILLNGDPASSRYDRTNFDQWSWDQLRLLPGDNTVVFGGTNLGVTAAAQLCWRPTWMA